MTSKTKTYQFLVTCLPALSSQVPPEKTFSACFPLWLIFPTTAKCLAHFSADLLNFPSRISGSEPWRARNLLCSFKALFSNFDLDPVDIKSYLLQNVYLILWKIKSKSFQNINWHSEKQRNILSLPVTVAVIAIVTITKTKLFILQVITLCLWITATLLKNFCKTFCIYITNLKFV